MSHLVPVRLLVTLCAAALTLATTAAGAAPAGAAGTGGGVGIQSLPAGRTACASTPAKPSSPLAACTTAGANARAATAAAFTIDLKADPGSLAPGGTTTLTAISNQDVGPTDFHINIFDATSGKFLAACGTGTTCSTSVTRTDSAVRSYLADIASDLAFPPQNPQAVSGTVTVTWIAVGLTASATVLQPGGTTTLTATSTLDIGPTQFLIEIFDTFTRSLVTSCRSGTTCAATVTRGSAIASYVAYVAEPGSTSPPPDVRAQSAPVLVTWISLGLTASPASLPANSTSTVTATSSLDVGPTPYFIQIFDQDGSARFVCSSGTACSFPVSQSSLGTHTYVAYVGRLGSSTSPPPPDVRATSNTVSVTWTPPPFVTVPSVLTFDPASADQAIRSVGLVPSGSGHHTCQSPGLVYIQHPLPGNDVPYGSTVTYEWDTAAQGDCGPPK